jgi:hypothetical protein
MPTARFFFDAGSGGALWMASEQEWQRWGQPVDLARLPISAQLRDEVEQLVERYDQSLNWDSPADPGPWRQPEYESFNEAARRALTRLRLELGPEWEVVDGYQDLSEGR